jgi:hypothetical protein
VGGAKGLRHSLEPILRRLRVSDRGRATQNERA